MSNTSALMYLDSDDRENKVDADVTNVSFVTNFRANQAVRLAMSSYDFVYAINNINNNNRTAFIDTAIQTFPVTLTNGNYNYAQLAVEIAIQLNTLGLGLFVVTFANGVYNITAPVPIRFITNPQRPNSRDWGDMITMTKSPPLRSTLLIGGIPDISYTNKLYVICDPAHRFKVMGDESTVQKLNNVLGVVYVNDSLQMAAPDPSTINIHHATRDIHNTKWVMHRNNEDVGVMTILLLDDRGERLPSDQLNKLRWSIELMIQD